MSMLSAFEAQLGGSIVWILPPSVDHIWNFPLSRLIAMLIVLLSELRFHVGTAKSCLLFVRQKNPTN